MISETPFLKLVPSGSELHAPRSVPVGHIFNRLESGGVDYLIRTLIFLQHNVTTDLYR